MSKEIDLGSRAGLSTSAAERLRAHLLADAWAFTQIVCRHTDYTDGFHKPLVYLVARQVELLAPILSDPREQSYVVRAIRRECTRHGVDWATPEGLRKLFELTKLIDLRAYRGSGKSSLVHDVDLWMGTRNPNITTLILSVSDDKAADFCRQLRDVVISDVYRDLFPHRVPDTVSDLTEDWIRLKGRDNNSPQVTFQSYGYTSKSLVGGHFSRFSVDDLQVEENSGDTENAGVQKFLAGIPSLYEPREIERVHAGTRYREDDDFKFLRDTGQFFSLSIPIEEHEGYAANILIRGTPTNPGWPNSGTVEEITALQAVVLGGPMGAWSWRRNQLLDPIAQDERMFPAALVDAAVYEAEKIKGKDYVGRPLYEADGSYKRADDGTVLYRYVPVERLSKVFGCDLATADTATADDWAICCLGTDEDGFEYELEIVADKGWSKFENALEFLEGKWKPRRIGVEKASGQEALITLMKEKRRFRRLAHKVEMLSHRNINKGLRILNNVAERMKMGRLLGNPADHATMDEKKRYRPEAKNPVDNRLDAIALATVINRQGQSQGFDAEKIKRDARLRKKRRTDPSTGVPLY